MPPKVKITRENIISASLETVRENGADSLNARAIAERLGCSTQPVFSNFADMNELKFEVINAAQKLYEESVEKYVNGSKYPPYKASGMAYVDFAAKESELFKLLFMRDRGSDDGRRQKIDDAMFDGVARKIEELLNVSDEEARTFHLEMWSLAHGIAVMAATHYLVLDEELVSRMLTDCYNGLIKETK